MGKPQTLNKNWRSIAKIEDDNMRLAMSTLDQNSAEGRRMAAALPQYFTTDPEIGPFSLAAMRQKARQNGLQQHGSTGGELRINSYDAVPAGLRVCPA